MLLGNFDGMHRGHAELLTEGRRLALERAAPLAILQCDPHPRAFFSGMSRFRVATGPAQIRLITSAGIDLIYAPRFDMDFASLAAEDFVEEHLVARLGVSGIVIGRDFRFGRQRLGDAALLQRMRGKHGFCLSVIVDEIANGARISTSSVRMEIIAGNIAAATRLLGHDWVTEIGLDDAGRWQVAADQILPPAGKWPLLALDHRGEEIAPVTITIDLNGQAHVCPPVGTAFLRWVPVTLSALTGPADIAHLSWSKDSHV